MVLSVAAVPNVDGAIAALVRSEGSAAEPWPAALLTSVDSRDLTDSAHALCILYGGHPDPIAAASARSDDRALRRWLADAAAAFSIERQALAAVVAAAGPLPSTPKQAQSEATLAHQRHALETLARSDRAGCAIGAAVALVLDWRTVRRVVNRVAGRAGVDLATSQLPGEEPPAVIDPLLERARLFGARQLLAQQRGVWQLLEARAAARRH
jgi:hypothetical protein